MTYDEGHNAVHIEYLKARPVVTIAEAAELTTLSPSGIRRSIKDGAIPARKIGRRVLIETSVLLDWIAA